jgi:enolase
MTTIKGLVAREVLDSRGNPTVEAELTTESFKVTAIVPSGASTGTHEALELRDKDNRYQGKGVQQAVRNVNDLIGPALINNQLRDPSQIDKIMVKMDGTPNKSKLGANAILAVSMAAFRAKATEEKKPLYQYIHDHFRMTQMRMPVPFANVINGGKHAGGELYMQEFMIAPIGAPSFKEAARMVSETYWTLKGLVKDKYGASAINVGDEGGFAPPLKMPEEALDLINAAIQKAGFDGVMKIALDPASSEFFKDGTYQGMTPQELLDKYAALIDKYPIISIEDGFAEDDYDSWAAFKLRFPSLQIVGDDLLVTNMERIRTAEQKQLCNALLLKVNQVGTVTEAVEAAKLALHHGWNVMVANRSGETEDAFIADLAVALGCGMIKLGAPCRSERLAKYNRLLRIEETISGVQFGVRK